MSTMKDSLEIHFRTLGLPTLAAKWLLDLWDAIQFLDDVVDGDPIDKSTAYRRIFTLLFELPANPFFADRRVELLPLLSNAVLKWKASDTVELAGAADAKSYMWRASYYDVVMGVVLICNGPDVALDLADRVMNMYGESFVDYMEEFQDA